MIDHLPYLLSQTIEHSAQRMPDQEAFRYGSRSLTYSALIQQADQLAAVLMDHGLRRGDRVGIYLNRCLETAIAIYGIWRAGGVYVPLNPGAPSARSHFLIRNCGIQHIVTNPFPGDNLFYTLTKEHGVRLVVGVQGDGPIETMSWGDVFQFPANRWPVRVLEHDLAYIMFTSGSTGIPKGIMHTHHSGMSYAKLSARLYDVRPGDRVGNHAPLFFDISTFGYFTVPLMGATTVIVPDAHAKMPASLSQLIQDEGISIWYSVPLALIQMLERGAIEKRDWSTLRWVLFGGEPFPPKHLRDLMRQLPKTRFSNVYGPAEVNQCTYYHLPEPPNDEEAVPLGQVWENTEMLIVDEDDRDVAAGDTGELLIRTATMMRGYWKQAELTRASILTRNTAPGLEARYYRTGDLVRLDDQGRLMFLGRKDRQIKVRGFRIELDEIESSLVTHKAVQEAAVFAVKDDAGAHIQAAVILKNEEEATEEMLADHLRATLLPFAMPERIVIVRSLPRTPTGKIDRPALVLELLKPSES